MKSLYSKIIIPITTLIVMALTSIMIFSVININFFISPDIKKITKDLILSKSNEVSYWLNMRIGEMQQLSEGIKVETLTEEKIIEYIRKLKKYAKFNDENYESLGIITKEGVKYLTSDDIISVGGRSYFQEISKGEEEYVVTDPIRSKANNKAIILIIMKLRNEEGQVTGYMSGAVSMDYLQEIINEANIYNFPLILYNNRTKNVLVSNEDKHIGYDNEKKFTKVEGDIAHNTNWKIQMMVPDSFINRKITVTGYIILIFGIGVILTTIYILNRYVKSIVKPIEELKNHMNLVEKGKLNTIEPDRKSIELNSLGNSYNTMIKNIENLISKLEFEETLKKEAEYKALYSQIKPHFLYNTLETIQAMAIEQDNEEVETAIGDLATLFRIGLSSDKSFIPIEKELEHLESYVSIQLLRYKNRFTYTLDKEGLIYGSKFMKFTLQPLVENAIYHGIKLMDEEGYIRVKINKENNAYVIEIINSCKEVDFNKIQRVNFLLETSFEERNEEKGYGLYNVNQRLKLNFGREYGVKLVPEKNQVIAIVTHPILEEEN